MTPLERQLSRLDPEQRAIAELNPGCGHRQVLANAGTGKSTSCIGLLTRRIISCESAPNEIIYLTFMKRAADEMAMRLERQVGKRSMPEVGTWHSKALAIMRRVEPQRWRVERCIDLGANARTPAVPSVFVFWRCAVEYGSMPGTRAPSLRIREADSEDYRKAVSIMRAHGMRTPEEARKNGWDAYGVRFPSIFDAWRLVIDAMADLAAWDFDDVLFAWLDALSDGRAPTYRLVAVDEAQDNSVLMDQLARALAGINIVRNGEAQGDAVLVGDPKQAIYRFRGATPELFNTMPDRYPGAVRMEITTNYRSLAGIVTLGNAICLGRPWNIGSPSKAFREGEAEMTWLEAEDPAAACILDIVRRVEAGASYSDFAILTRTNDQLISFNAYCVDMEIPCTMTGKTSLFATKEAQAFLGYCILSVTDHDRAYAEVANTPMRYLSKAFVENPPKTLRDLEGREGTAHAKEAMASLAALIRKLRALPWAQVPGAIVAGLDAERKEKATAIREPDEDKPGLYLKMAELAGRFSDAASFVEFADRASKTRVNSGDSGSDTGVRLSTVHGAKGLEWKHVYLLGTKGTFPYQRKLPNGKGWKPTEDAEDERRLFYVAVTRAKDALTMLVDSGDVADDVAEVRGFFP